MYSLEDIAMIHLRAVSGQSANQELGTGIPLTREYIKANPKYAFVVHATVQQAMPSIEKSNLRPMGRRESDTRPTNFGPYISLANDPESLRFQTDVIIVYSGYALCNCKEVTVTSNGYVNLHDKEGIPLSSAIFAYDLYRKRFWYSDYRQKYYAPIPQIYEHMVTPKSQAKSGSEHLQISTSTCGSTANLSGWRWKITQRERLSDALRLTNRRLQMPWKIRNILIIGRKLRHIQIHLVHSEGHSRRHLHQNRRSTFWILHIRHQNQQMNKNNKHQSDLKINADTT